MELLQSGCEGGAEAVLELKPNSSLSIAYHPRFGPHDDLMLIELDEKLLPDFLHQSVTLRGQPDEDAVLCTLSKTYAVKFVGSSNSVFLIPPSDSPISREASEDASVRSDDKKTVASVIKVAPGCMELVEVAPRLDKLRMLLSQNPYTFDEASEMDTSEAVDEDRFLYTWDDLVESVQASDEELRGGLQALSAVEINGYWRILDEKYMDAVLNMLLHNSVINNWSLNRMIEDDVLHVMEGDGFPRKIAKHCIQVHGSKVQEGSSRSSIWKLDEKKICVHFAREILRGKKMKTETFLEEWRLRIPDGMKPCFEMLEGEVLTEKLGIDTWVYAFSVSSLSSVPAERFSVLFQERPKWEWKDLHPYVRDLKVPGLSLEGLMLKYTRRTQPTADAEPIFSVR
nr:sister chromatid cohesion protein DCC1 [Ipomoea trifida]